MTRPTPIELRVVRGNPGKRPIPKGTPKPGGKPRAPSTLTVEQRAVWLEFIKPAAWLSRADAAIAVVFCCLYAEFLADPATMQAAKISNMRAAASSLGFDPAARARLGNTALDGAIDEAERMFG